MFVAKKSFVLPSQEDLQFGENDSFLLMSSLVSVHKNIFGNSNQDKKNSIFNFFRVNIRIMEHNVFVPIRIFELNFATR